MASRDVPSSTTNQGVVAPNRSSAPVPAPGRLAAAAATQDIVLMKRRIKDIEDKADEHEITIQTLQDRDAQARSDEEERTLRIECLEAQNKQLKAQLGVVLQALGIDIDSMATNRAATQAPPATSTSGNSESAPVAVAAGGEPVVKMEPSSATAQDSSSDIRKITSAALNVLYGVSKLNLSLHGDYPAVPKSHMAWPAHMEKGARVPLHRFDFTEPYNSDKNKETYELWIQTSLNQGPALSGVTHLTSSELNRKSVVSDCGKLYSSLKSRYKSLAQKRAGPAIRIKRKIEAVDGAGATQIGLENSPENDLGGFFFTNLLQSDSLDAGHLMSLDDETHVDAPIIADPYNDAPVVVAGPSDPGVMPALVPPSSGAPHLIANNHPDTLRSRKAVKCAMRLRKRPYLKDAAVTKYKGPKYDSYFTAGAMSEDEEIISAFGSDGQVKASHFEAHAYEFVSDELISIRDAIDSIPDPTSSNKTPRRRGANKSGPPHVSLVVDTGMRTWMIKKEVLDEHPEWLTESRVYPSGPEWGEEEPSSARHSRKIAKKIRTNMPGLELARQADAEVLRAQQKLEEFRNSRTI